ncbi:MAG: tRNA 2-thiouridine(34) synthase MnmA [Acidobacteria bacterium]|nr:tRNA 2-thiouridine(34) synthase MnmA [Acidobacteriota bacterium]
MRIAVAMSGGVDSSVAALLLAREGADVVGLSMHLWNHDRDGSGAAEGRCCTLDDLATARRAAEKIGIPHFVLNLERQFTEAVVKPFVAAYLAGETPIPCTSCNTQVKFRSLLERAAGLGCDAVATGHYARLERDPESGSVRLLRARDESKDQTYFLYDLSAAQLERARFPLGDLTKDEVRELAREAGLPNWNKPDSQEVCFVPNAGGPAGFVKREAESLGLALPSLPGARRGPIEHVDGRSMGEHEGVYHFTVGQRRGLGIATGDPLYVVSLDAENARVVVGPREALAETIVPLRDVSFVETPRETELRVLARIRYRHPEQAATLRLGPRGEGTLRFDEPVRAAAPGQSAVFFDPARPEWLLGGGTITR